MFETRITKLFGIKYPIIGGAMGGISNADLVAAISNAGCLGLLVTAMFEDKEGLRQEIRKTKALTDKPFGVNLSLFPSARPLPNEDFIAVCIEEGVAVIETSGRSPEPLMPLIRQGKSKFIHKCARVRDAIKVASLGADAVTIVGFECGGHPGMDDVTTLILAPLTTDSVSIPVIAGGGIVDGRGLVAALALGVDGIVMGTRFMATKECPVHANVKEWMVNAGEADTVVIQRSVRSNSRVAKTPPAAKVAEMEGRGAPLEELMTIIAGSRGRQASIGGDMNAGIVACGEAVSLIRDIPTVQEVVERIISEADAIRKKLGQ